MPCRPSLRHFQCGKGVCLADLLLFEAQNTSGASLASNLSVNAPVLVPRNAEEMRRLELVRAGAVSRGAGALLFAKATLQGRREVAEVDTGNNEEPQMK